MSFISPVCAWPPARQDKSEPAQRRLRTALPPEPLLRGGEVRGLRYGEHGGGFLGDPGALEVLTYNDAIMMIGGLFVAALFMMPLVRRPRATPVSTGH